MGVLRKLVCEKCGESVEIERRDPTDLAGEWRVFDDGVWVFCPRCWKGYLQTVKKYVCHFATAAGIKVDPEYHHNALMIVSHPMMEALKDLQKTHNVWDVSIRDVPETIKADIDF